MRASSGTPSDSSAKSSQSMRMPAARAMATRWMVWLVEPPVASKPTMPLTTQRSSTMSASAGASAATARCTAYSVRAARSGVPGFTKEEPGSCSPMISSSIWLELAVP